MKKRPYCPLTFEEAKKHFRIVTNRAGENGEHITEDEIWGKLL